MYTKEEVSRQKQAFWTTFGRYMQPVLAADGNSVSWLNYKTGIPGIQFKMDADQQQASIAILLSHKDLDVQTRQYERLLQLKDMLEGNWSWQQDTADEYDKPVSRVQQVLSGVNIHRRDDWPAMISFLKERIIALDAFWSMAKYGFEEFL